MISAQSIIFTLSFCIKLMQRAHDIFQYRSHKQKYSNTKRDQRRGKTKIMPGYNALCSKNHQIAERIFPIEWHTTKRIKPEKCQGNFFENDQNTDKRQIITTWEMVVQTHHSPNRWWSKQKCSEWIWASWMLAGGLQQIRMIWFGSLIQPIDLCLRTIVSIQFAPVLKDYTFIGLESFYAEYSKLMLTRMDDALRIRVKFNQFSHFPNEKWIQREADEHWREHVKRSNVILEWIGWIESVANTWQNPRTKN